MIAVGVDTHKDSHFAVALDQLGQAARGARRSRPVPPATASLSAGLPARGGWAAARLRDRGRGQLGRRPMRAPAARPGAVRGGRASASARATRPASLTASTRWRRPRGCLAARALSTPRGGAARCAAALLIAQRSVRERAHEAAQPDPGAARHRAGRAARADRRGQRQPARAAPGGDACPQGRASRRARGARGDARSRGPFARARRRRAPATSASSPSSSLARPDAAGGGRASGRSRPPSCWSATPRRFKSEAAFARCNGTAPIPASSGKTVRHRLNRGGDRQVNNAIHTIALSALTAPPRDARLPRPQNQRGQDQARSDALPQAPPLPQPLQRLAEMPLTS